MPNKESTSLIVELIKSQAAESNRSFQRLESKFSTLDERLESSNQFSQDTREQAGMLHYKIEHHGKSIELLRKQIKFLRHKYILAVGFWGGITFIGGAMIYFFFNYQKFVSIFKLL